MPSEPKRPFHRPPPRERTSERSTERPQSRPRSNRSHQRSTPDRSRSIPRPKASLPPPPGSEHWPSPWVQIKYFSFHPAIFPNMVGASSADATPGSLVQVYDKTGQAFGSGFFNPQARVPLRLLHHGSSPFTEAQLDARLVDAIHLRLHTLKLPATTEAYRIIHSDGDNLPGLIIDRYANTLSIEITTLAIAQRIQRWLPILHQELGTKHQIIQIDPDIALMENIRRSELSPLSAEAPTTARFTENGIRYGVNFETAHKTGFFCDHRDNRRRIGQWATGRVLDLCCYTGGFSLSARLKAGCEDVTGVDLDENAIAQARQNANYNQTRINFVHADAFTWARQMIKNGELWDTIILDPPKLLHRRDDQEEGIFKYRDLNALPFQLLRPGGLLLTCSCSGLLSTPDFEDLVIGSAHRHQRKLQILDRTGPGADHPVMSNCPESRYLKTLWARVM